MALTMQDAVQKEKEALFKEIRHIVDTSYNCPKHLTMEELYSILTILKVEE